jgi:hypothetical protein
MSTILVWEPRELKLQVQTQGIFEAPAFISALRLKRLGNGRAHRQDMAQTSLTAAGGQAIVVFPIQPEMEIGIGALQDPSSMEMTPLD